MNDALDLGAPLAFLWGQRYAIVADPEGYMIDLFAWV